MAKRTRASARGAGDGSGSDTGGAGSNNGLDNGGSGETIAPSGSVINPAGVAGSGDGDDGNGGDGTGGRRTRSDAGRKRGPRQKADTINLGEFADIVRELHAGLAAITACPEWGIDDKESETLGKALSRVIDYYDLNKIAGVATHPLAGVARVAWAIYMPRILAIRLRKMSDNARPVNNPPSGLAPPAAPPPQPPQPQAPMQAAPQQPPQARSPIGPQPGTMRANPIPGFPGVVIDVPFMKPN